ncbi:MAG: MFS transporter [Immundisolibacteraceae bacterium]|nr:MFS transporter [Immundisolibacteraceae bacterium]
MISPTPLKEATEERLYGGKAAQLAIALQAGLPAPDGLALSAEFVEAVYRRDPLALNLIEDYFEQINWPVAVRSSGIGEDGADSSFAGQHDTLLNVIDADQAIAAICQVRESAHSDAALKYRERMGLPTDVEIGVVIQRLVNPDCSGVLFTRNPITGADERVLEAAWGFGEIVVSGLVTPDHYRFESDGTLVEATAGYKDILLTMRPDGGLDEHPVEPDKIERLCVSDEQLKALNDLAKRCEKLYGGEQDIEWAFAGDELYLLQRRAVTAIGTASTEKPTKTISPERPAAPNSAHPPRRFFIGLLLAAGLAPLNSTMIAVALPAIGIHFGAAPADLTQWLVTSYLMLCLVMQSPGGKIGDLWGRSLALQLGLLFFFLGSVAGAFAFSMPILIGARLLMALGGALLLPAAMAAMRNVVAADQRGRIFGMLGAILGLSAAIGPPLGGWLTQQFGWSSVFWINAPVIIAAALLTRGLTLKTEATQLKPKLDLLGIGLLASTLLSAVSVVHLDGTTQLAAAIASLAFLWLFVRLELRTEQPVLDPRMFKRLQFSAGLGVGSVQNFCMYGMLFQVPYMLQNLHGLGPTVAGQMLLAMTAGMVICSPIGGRFADRFGARLSVLLGSSLGLVAMATLSMGQPWDQPTALVPWLIMLGAGLGFSTGPSQAAALSAVDPRHSGMASGALSMFRYVASVSAITLLGVLLALAEQNPIALYQSGFWIYGAGFLITGLLAFGLPKHGVTGH